MSSIDIKDVGHLYEIAKEYSKLVDKKDFDICNPKQAKIRIIKILSTTGDKHAAEDEVEHMLESMMESCHTGAAIGAGVIAQTNLPKEAKRKLSSWNCYLKWCSKFTPLNFPSCLTDSKMKETNYIPHKDEWNEIAKKDCKGLEDVTFAKYV